MFNVNIVSTHRYSAMNKYTDYLHSQLVYFHDLSSGPLFGEGISDGSYKPSIYDAPVTLTPDATVLEHFVQLLGNDTNLRFYITPRKSVFWDYNIARCGGSNEEISLQDRIFHLFFKQR